MEDATVTTAEAEGKRIEDKKASKGLVYVNFRDPAEDRRLYRHEKWRRESSMLTANHPGKNTIHITSKAHLGRVCVEYLHSPPPQLGMARQ